MSPRVEIIYWRDIPAQVIARDGTDVHRVELTERFQAAIDRAATKAGLTGTDEYLAEWRKERSEVEGDPAAVAAGEAERMEAAFTTQVLEAYVANLARAP